MPSAGYIYDPNIDYYSGVNEDFFSQENDKFNAFITNIVNSIDKEDYAQEYKDFYSAIEPTLSTETAKLSGDFIKNPMTGEWFQYDQNFFNPNYVGYDASEFFRDMKSEYGTAQDYLNAYGLGDDFDLSRHLEFLTTKGAHNTDSRDLKEFFSRLGATQNELPLYDYYTADPVLAQQALTDLGLYSTEISDPRRFELFLEGINEGTINQDDYLTFGGDQQGILNMLLQKNPNLNYYVRDGEFFAIPEAATAGYKFLPTGSGMGDWLELLTMDTSYMNPIANLSTEAGRRAAGLTGGVPYVDQRVGGGTDAAGEYATSDPTDINDPHYKNNPDYRWDKLGGWLYGGNLGSDWYGDASMARYIPANAPTIVDDRWDDGYSYWFPEQNEGKVFLSRIIKGIQQDYEATPTQFNNYMGLTDRWRDFYWNNYIDAPLRTDYQRPASSTHLNNVLALFGDVEGRNFREPGYGNSSIYPWRDVEGSLTDAWLDGKVSTEEFLNLQGRNLSTESYIGALNAERNMLNAARNMGWGSDVHVGDGFVMAPESAYNYLSNQLKYVDPEWRGLTIGELEGIKLNATDPRLAASGLTLQDLGAMHFGAPAGWVPTSTNTAGASGTSALYPTYQFIRHGDSRDPDDYIRDMGLNPGAWAGALSQIIPLFTTEQLESGGWDNNSPIFFPFYMGGQTQSSPGDWRYYGFNDQTALMNALNTYGIEAELPEDLATPYVKRSGLWGNDNPNAGWILPGGINQLINLGGNTANANNLLLGTHEEKDGGGFFGSGLGTLVGLALSAFGAPPFITRTMGLINAVANDSPLSALGIAFNSIPDLHMPVYGAISDALGIPSIYSDDWAGLTFEDANDLWLSDFGDKWVSNIANSGIATLGSALMGLPWEGPLASTVGSVVGGLLPNILPDNMSLNTQDFLSTMGRDFVTSALLGQDFDFIPMLSTGIKGLTSGLIGGEAGGVLGSLAEAALKYGAQDEIQRELQKAANIYTGQDSGSTSGGTSGGTSNSGTQTGGNGSTIQNTGITASQEVMAKLMAIKIGGSSPLSQMLYPMILARLRGET